MGMLQVRVDKSLLDKLDIVCIRNNDNRQDLVNSVLSAYLKGFGEDGYVIMNSQKEEVKTGELSFDTNTNKPGGLARSGKDSKPKAVSADRKGKAKRGSSNS